MAKKQAIQLHKEPHRKPYYKRITARLNHDTYQHLQELEKSQHSTLKQVITDLINATYKQQPTPLQMTPEDKKVILKYFLSTQKFINIINSSIIHDSISLNQIAFKTNVHDFKNKHPDYIQQHKDELINAIRHDDYTIHSIQDVLKIINKEMYSIWLLLI